MGQADDNQEPEAPDPNLKTPAQWRDVIFPPGSGGRPHEDAWKHGAAGSLHGWELHRFHTGEDLKLSREDYEAALKAAFTLVPVSQNDKGLTRATYKPHEPALAAQLKQKGGDQ